MYLLDTAFISEFTKASPDPAVETWLVEQREETLFISVLTIGELEHGIQLLPLSRRRRRLEALTAAILARTGRRVLAVDERVALAWAAISAAAHRRGRRLPEVDALLTATAYVHHLRHTTHQRFRRSRGRGPQPMEPRPLT